MANSTLKQAGHFSLKSFRIINFKRTKNLDINRLIHTFNIYESMNTGSIRGSATVYDAIDVLSGFPLVGEELVEITYSDFFDVLRTDVFFLYAITDVSNPDENSGKIQSYKIHFVSPSKFYSENFTIMKSYRPVGAVSKISDYVEQVYEEYYRRPLVEAGLKPKSIIVEETTGIQQYTIPRYSPEQTMHFFSRRAQNPASNTQLYRFFENRDKHYFVSNDYLLKEGKNFTGYGNGLVDPKLAAAAGLSSNPVPIFRRNYLPDLGADRQPRVMYEIISIDYGERVNTIEDMNEGAYRRVTNEIDILNGAIIQYPYEHLEEFNESDQKLIHTEEFVNSLMTKDDVRFVIKDYATTGANSGKSIRYDQYYPKIHNSKRSNSYHYNKNRVMMTIYGRNTIFAGSIIDLDLNIAKSNVIEKDKEKSGRYIVEAVDNIFFENTYRQKLTLSRGGIGI